MFAIVGSGQYSKSHTDMCKAKNEVLGHEGQTSNVDIKFVKVETLTMGEPSYK